MDSPMFWAKHPDDELHFTPKIKEIQSKAHKALEDGKVQDFCNCCFELMGELEQLPPSNPLFIDGNLMFVGSDTPGHHILETMFSKAFEKSRTTNNRAAPNNHTGYALNGARGVGKTTVLRQCALIVGILLPNVLPLYVDYQHSNSPKPRHLIAAAARQMGLLQDLDPNAQIASILLRLNKMGIAVLFFADEVHVAYKPELWNEFSNLATGMGTMLCVAGSKSTVPTMIRGDSERLQELGYTNPLVSLNDTKLYVLDFNPLSTIDQYRTFLGRRYPSVLAKSRAESADAFIKRLHLSTGGNMRRIATFMTSGHADDPTLPFAHGVSLPDRDSAEFTVLASIFHQCKDLNPFAVPAISELKAVGLIGDYYKRNSITKHPNPILVLSRMEDKSLISKHSNGSGYTFGSAPIMELMRKQIPRVFVSHVNSELAMDNFVVALRASGVDVTYVNNRKMLKH